MRFVEAPASLTARAAFTLAEVLAALALLAIVVPVVFEALHIATQSGEVAQRKALAARVAQKVIEQTVITRQWNQGVQNGTEQVGQLQFRWTLHNDAWNQTGANGKTTTLNTTTANPNAIHQLSVEVTYPVQGRQQSVQLATLIDTSQQ